MNKDSLAFPDLLMPLPTPTCQIGKWPLQLLGFMSDTPGWNSHRRCQCEETRHAQQPPLFPLPSSRCTAKCLGKHQWLGHGKRFALKGRTAQLHHSTSSYTANHCKMSGGLLQAWAFSRHCGALLIVALGLGLENHRCSLPRWNWHELTRQSSSVNPFPTICRWFAPWQRCQMSVLKWNQALTWYIQKGNRLEDKVKHSVYHVQMFNQTQHMVQIVDWEAHGT